MIIMFILIIDTIVKTMDVHEIVVHSTSMFKTYYRDRTPYMYLFL